MKAGTRYSVRLAGENVLLSLQHEEDEPVAVLMDARGATLMAYDLLKLVVCMPTEEH